MMDRSDVVAVAHLDEKANLDDKKHRIDLVLVRALKGNVKPGKYRVTFADLPRGGLANTDFVAFFRKGLCWRFVAYPTVPGGKLAESVLQVEGFCDSNAYIVDPGLVTLDHIETFLQGGGPIYRFRDPLYFPKRGHDSWRPGSLELDVS